MKLVTAIVQPEKFSDIRAALEDFGIQGMTVSEANGYGRQMGHKEVYRGQSFTVNLLPKIRIEILTTEERAVDIVDLIISTANTGSSGDGKIWLTNVDEAIRVRTGERGETAI